MGELTEPNKLALVRGPGCDGYSKRQVVAALPDYGIHILSTFKHYDWIETSIAAIPNSLICVCTTSSLPGGSGRKYPAWQSRAVGRVNQDMDQVASTHTYRPAARQSSYESYSDSGRRRRLAHGLTSPFLNLIDKIESAAPPS